MGTLYVLTYGFVLVVTHDRAYIIRRWGTTKDIGELANGPLLRTKCEEIPAPNITLEHIIFSFPVQGW